VLRAAWVVLFAALVAVHVVYPAARPVHADTVMTGGKMLLSWPDLVDDTRRNAFEPAFYLAIKTWCGLAGVSLRALLAPAAACAVAAPCVLAWAIRPWVPGARTRLFAAALAGLHPAAVLYGSGLAKPYAELTLLAVFGAGAWIRALDAASESRSATRWLAAFAATSVVAAQLHFPGLLIPLVAAVHGLVAARRGVRLRRAATWAVATLAVAGALALAWHDRIETRLVEGQGMSWIEQVRGGSLARAIATDVESFVWGVPLPNLAGTSPAERIGAALLLAAAAGLVWTVSAGRHGRGARSRAALLGAAFVIPFVAVGSLDVFRPIYFTRYVAVAVLPASVTAALAVESLVRSGHRRLAGGVAALLSVGRAAGFCVLGFATASVSPGARYLAALDRARSAGATLVVLPRGHFRAPWRRWIDVVHGAPPRGVDVAWGDAAWTSAPLPVEVAADGADAPQSFVQALAAHRRIVVATPAIVAVGALHADLEGWRVVSSEWSATYFDGATGRRRPSQPLTLLERDAIR